MVKELLNYIPMETPILAIYTHTVSVYFIYPRPHLYTIFQLYEQVMARKVKKMSKGANSSRKRNGGRTPVVEYVSSPIHETYERNDDFQVSDDDASRNEASVLVPLDLVHRQDEMRTWIPKMMSLRSCT
ncbi:hypothetical protein OROHE_016895 [Orobanche hederae]